MMWKRLLRRRALDRELDEEIRADFRMAIEDRVLRGETPLEAERNVRREFGNELLVREVTRDMWGWAAWERIAQDLTYALRQMRRTPGFTAVSLLTLALGSGAATAIFSIVNGVLVNPLRFREPERLYTAENVPPAGAGLTRNLPVNARHFHEWRTHCRSCEDVALFQGANLTLVGAGEPVRLPALDVSFNFFRTLGVQPALGRDFLASEEGAGSADKVILTDTLWNARFSRDRSIVGRRIQINGEQYFLSPKYRGGVRRGFIEEMVDKLARIPGVEGVGAVSQLPLLGEEWVSGLRDPDQSMTSAQENAIANFRFVTPEYFRTMGIPLRRGRFLDPGDRSRASAVISERAARFLWGNDNPLGKHVSGAGPRKPPLEVVGVVGEVRGKLERTPPMMVSEHFWRMQPIAMSFVLRTYAAPAPVANAIRSILASADPEMAISSARTMEQILDESVASRKLQMYLAVAFAIAALALASLGIYGIISFTVARRTPEMGIRIALGASGEQLVWMVVRHGMLPVGAGLCAGVVCGLIVSRLIASQLFGVAPNDPLSIVGVAILLLSVALCACWIPARRATRIDPLRALRFE